MDCFLIRTMRCLSKKPASFRAHGGKDQEKPARICGNFLAKPGRVLQRKHAVCHHCPPRLSAQSCAGWQHRSHATPFCPCKKRSLTSKSVLISWLSRARGCMGHVLASVPWSIVHADSQSTALISNLSSFQIKRKKAMSITALCHCPCCQRGIKPYPGFFCWAQTF